MGNVSFVALKVQAFCWHFWHPASPLILPKGKTIMEVGFIWVMQVISAGSEVTGFTRSVCFVATGWPYLRRPPQANAAQSERAKRAPFLCLFVLNVSRIAFGYFVLSDENQRLPHPSLPCLRLPCFINVSPQYCPLSYTSNLLSLSFWM